MFELYYKRHEYSIQGWLPRAAGEAAQGLYPPMAV